MGLPRWLSSKNLPASVGDAGDMGSIPGRGRYPVEGNDNPLQYPYWTVDHQAPLPMGFLKLEPF